MNGHEEIKTNAAAEIFQEVFQPLDGFDIQVVGQFIRTALSAADGYCRGIAALRKPAAGQYG